MYGLLLLCGLLTFQSPGTPNGSSFSEPHLLPSRIFPEPLQYFSQPPNDTHDHSTINQLQAHTQFFTVNSSANSDPDVVTIETLLKFPERFHQKLVTVRGIVKQPEMHLDETELYFDFVFVLQNETVSLIVFGHHDRTQGGSPIAMDQHVEVTGIFWKDRIAHDYHFENNLEAITITPYPSLIPNRTSLDD